MKGGSLPGYALIFVAGFFVGFMYSHIASDVHAHDTLAVDGSVRLRSMEARLAQLEARAAVVPAGARVASIEGGGADGGATSDASTPLVPPSPPGKNILHRVY